MNAVPGSFADDMDVWSIWQGDCSHRAHVLVRVHGILTVVSAMKTSLLQFLRATARLTDASVVACPNGTHHFTFPVRLNSLHGAVPEFSLHSLKSGTWGSPWLPSHPILLSVLKSYHLSVFSLLAVSGSHLSDVLQQSPHCLSGSSASSLDTPNFKRFQYFSWKKKYIRSENYQLKNPVYQNNHFLGFWLTEIQMSVSPWVTLFVIHFLGIPVSTLECKIACFLNKCPARVYLNITVIFPVTTEKMKYGKIDFLFSTKVAFIFLNTFKLRHY